MFHGVGECVQTPVVPWAAWGEEEHHVAAKQHKDGVGHSANFHRQDAHKEKGAIEADSENWLRALNNLVEHLWRLHW